MAPEQIKGKPATMATDVFALGAMLYEALAGAPPYIGATAVEGDFGRGDVVSVLDPAGREIARGLANYGSAETARILRKPTAEFEAILGYMAEPELIHRDNLVVLA